MELFDKQYSTPKDLVQLLKRRQLIITDDLRAEEYLRNIGYYRLSAYFYPFLQSPKSTHLYKEDTSFQKVLDLYRFDRKLRLLIFNEIEKIEIAIRSTIVDITSEETNDPFWMTTERYFARNDRFQRTMTLIGKEYNQSKEDFINHFRLKYSNPFPPAWELSEILPLGVITRIYENIRSNQIRKRIAQRFYLNIPVFESWMTLITLTRNSCCHHSRMWNKENVIRTRQMTKMEQPWIDDNVSQRRVFFNLCIIKYFIDIISPNNHLKSYLLDLFTQFPFVDLSAMGFPADWEQQPLWKQ